MSAVRPTLPGTALVGTVVLVLAACSGGSGSPRAAEKKAASVVSHRTTTTTTSTSTTTATSSTTVPFSGLRPGDSGPRVSDLRQQLANQQDHALGAVRNRARAVQQTRSRFQTQLLEGLLGQGVLHDRYVDVLVSQPAANRIRRVPVQTREAYHRQGRQPLETADQLLANQFLNGLAH